MNLIFLDYLPLELGLKTPASLSYYSTRMILAAITSLVISIFLGPSFIRALKKLKISQSIRTEEAPLLGSLHAKKQDTPTMGGVLILFSMLISLFLWMDVAHTFTLILLLTTLLFGSLGGMDDWLKLKYRNSKGLRARHKFLLQILFSLALALYFFAPPSSDSQSKGHWLSPPTIKEYFAAQDPAKLATSQDSKQVSFKEFHSRLYVPLFKEPVLVFQGGLTLLGFLWVISVVTGASNAVNLTDGLDGLAAGCLIMVASGLAIIAFFSNNASMASYLHIPYIEGSGEIAIYLAAFVGACLGFLWYNGHPAEVFMGDIGSLTLGAIIGVSALLLKKEAYLAIIGGVFVLEALSVILQVASYRLRKKRRIFLCAPLHHHFEYKGWKETKVVVRFWIISLLFAIIGVLLLKFNN